MNQNYTPPAASPSGAVIEGSVQALSQLLTVLANPEAAKIQLEKYTTRETEIARQAAALGDLTAKHQALAVDKKVWVETRNRERVELDDARAQLRIAKEELISNQRKHQQDIAALQTDRDRLEADRRALEDRKARFNSTLQSL